ncbi:MAG: hypothetical protein MJ078_04470, partial [Clostridia bacterium]|nr:hypothetical protein [Clostridia bacterium]
MSYEKRTVSQPSVSVLPTKAELKKKIESKLFTKGITDPKTANAEQIYLAVVSVLKDILTERRTAFKKRAKAASSKKICYLCMEFLIGRSLENVSTNMGVYSVLTDVLQAFGNPF